MSSTDPYTVTHDAAAATRGTACDACGLAVCSCDRLLASRGRRLGRKVLSSSTEKQHKPDSLKITLTLPAGLRKKAMKEPEHHPRGAYAPTQTVQAPSMTSHKRGRPRKAKATDGSADYAPPRGHALAKNTVIRPQFSAPSRQQARPSSDTKKRFPTFVPADILSSDDLSGSESGDLTDHSEELFSPEEIIANDLNPKRERARTHRELFQGDDGQVPTKRPWDHDNKRQSSQKNTPVPTVIPAQIGDDSSDTDDEDDEADEDGSSDEDEDDEADEKSNGEAEEMSNDDEDDDEGLDARLFFSGLVDESSASEDEARTDGDSIMGDVIVAGGELSDTETDVEEVIEPLIMVKEGFDGQLEFSTDIHPTSESLDMALERIMPHFDDFSQTDSLANSFATLPVTQPVIISEDETYEMDSQAGDTTDDEIMPTSMPSIPPSTIAPQATVTPSKASSSHNRTLSAISFPSPADVLSRRDSMSWDILASPVYSIAATDDPPPRSRSTSMSTSIHSLGSRGPRMGFFTGASFGSKRTIIGDKAGKLPSPFSALTPPAPVLRRKRRANSDLGSFFNKRTRNSHTLLSSYFSDDLIAAPQGQLVDLDDFLDASLLSDDRDGDTSQTDVSSRWDRIPMGIYRQTRNTPAVHGSSMSFSFAVGGFGTPPISKPDLELQSSTRSHVSHGSIESAFWEDEVLSPDLIRRPDHHNHNKRHHRSDYTHVRELESLLSTSRAGPSRGDRTPTQSRAMLMEPSVDYLSEAKSRKDRRKEKKREKAHLQKQILSALDETLAEEYDLFMHPEEDTP